MHSGPLPAKGKARPPDGCLWRQAPPLPPRGATGWSPGCPPPTLSAVPSFHYSLLGYASHDDRGRGLKPLPPQCHPICPPNPLRCDDYTGVKITGGFTQPPCNCHLGWNIQQCDPNPNPHQNPNFRVCDVQVGGSVLFPLVYFNRLATWAIKDQYQPSLPDNRRLGSTVATPLSDCGACWAVSLCSALPKRR